MLDSSRLKIYLKLRIRSNYIPAKSPERERLITRGHQLQEASRYEKCDFRYERVSENGKLVPIVGITPKLVIEAEKHISCR